MVFGHKLWSSSNKSNIYCGTGMPGSAFWWRSKGEWIFIMLFLTSFDSNMADICLGYFGLWAPYSDYCMVCFFRKNKNKSDTVVALRRSLSKVPCIIVVSFINVYYEYFCECMWLSAKSQHVLELVIHFIAAFCDSSLWLEKWLFFCDLVVT